MRYIYLADYAVVEKVNIKKIFFLDELCLTVTNADI